LVKAKAAFHLWVEQMEQKDRQKNKTHKTLINKNNEKG